MTPHQANLFFIAEYVLTILILAFSAYRKNAFDWRKTIRRKTFIKRMIFLIPVALIAIAGSWPEIVPDATHFHATRVNPGWKLRRVATVGQHVFYR